MKEASINNRYRIYETGSIIDTSTNTEVPQNLSGSYYTVSLVTEAGNKKRYFVHRLLAEAFIPNPENLPTVRHINKDSKNNAIENLAWSSYSATAKATYSAVRRPKTSCVTVEVKSAVISVLKNAGSTPISLTDISTQAGITFSAARYAVLSLLASGTISRKPVQGFYSINYAYAVTEVSSQ